jgi:hypothetical protein
MRVNLTICQVVSIRVLVPVGVELEPGTVKQ